MRILIVTQRFRPLIGGAESVLWELACESVRRGHAITVVTAQWERNWPEHERVEGVRIVRIPLKRLRFLGTALFMRDLKRWLLDHAAEFDVWYVSMLKHCAWVAMGASWRCRVPVVLRPEGSGPTGDIAWHDAALGGRLIRRRCRSARAVVALSDQIRAELEGAGFDKDRIRDIPNGVPIPAAQDDIDRKLWRQRLGLNPQLPLAVFLGRLSPEKGVADLVAAWERVSRELPEAQLAVVGTGDQESELKSLAVKLPNILWVGAKQQPQRYLRAADLFVLPSHVEGMSIALLEAMAAGLPVVATDIPGNRVLIESGRHGLLVPPQRPDLLAKSILTQLQARTIAAGMGRAARDRVVEEFSIGRTAELHLALFDSLISKD